MVGVPQNTTLKVGDKEGEAVKVFKIVITIVKRITYTA